LDEQGVNREPAIRLHSLAGTGWPKCGVSEKLSGTSRAWKATLSVRRAPAPSRSHSTRRVQNIHVDPIDGRRVDGLRLRVKFHDGFTSNHSGRRL